MPYHGQTKCLKGFLYNSNGEKLMDICDIENVDMTFDDNWDESSSIYKDFTKELTCTIELTCSFSSMRKYRNLILYGWRCCGPLRRRALQRESMKKIRRYFNGNQGSEI